MTACYICDLEAMKVCLRRKSNLFLYYLNKDGDNILHVLCGIPEIKSLPLITELL